MPKLSCPDESDPQGNAQLARNGSTPAPKQPLDQPQGLGGDPPATDPNAPGAIVKVERSPEPSSADPGGPQRSPQDQEGTSGQRPPELIVAPGEDADVIAMANDALRSSWDVADAIFKKNTRLFSAIPSESLPAVNGFVAEVFKYVNYAEGCTRAIHNFPPARHGLNGIINWAWKCCTGQSQESAPWMDHYNCWLERVALPVWRELRAPYPTLTAALEAGIVKQLRDRTLDWVHENCIAGRCPKPLPADLDLGTANAGFVKHFQAKVEDIESTLFDLISGKKIPKVEVPSGVKKISETLKEKKPAGEK